MIRTPFILVVTSQYYIRVQILVVCLDQGTYCVPWLRRTPDGTDLAGSTHTDSPGASPGRERNGNVNMLHLASVVL